QPNSGSVLHPGCRVLSLWFCPGRVPTYRGAFPPGGGCAWPHEGRLPLRAGTPSDPDPPPEAAVDSRRGRRRSRPCPGVLRSGIGLAERVSPPFRAGIHAFRVLLGWHCGPARPVCVPVLTPIFAWQSSTLV